MANEKRMDQVILGLLSHESLTGYEIKKRIDTTLKYFWSASFGSIYPTLSQLEKAGRVSCYGVKENGRDKIVYSITEDGRQHLQEWLAVPVVKDELRYETLLKLFFGCEAGIEAAVGHINGFEEKVKKELPFLENSVKVLQKLPEGDTHTYYMITAMFGEMIYKTYLEWCEKAKDILQERNAQSSEREETDDNGN